jgi:hypothetical protein
MSRFNFAVILFFFAVNSHAESALTNEMGERIVNNHSAYIPPQCYTKTKDEQGKVSNPCYSCHVNGTRPNFLHDDGDLQLSYDFSDYSAHNRYDNLFKDRSQAVAKISDDQIDQYINTSNYQTDDGSLILAKTLSNVPQEWDANKDGTWNGYMPDIYFNFDHQGFDITPSGKESGWLAFGYYPFPGAFMPTNGSTDDVMIRLPQEFRRDVQGKFNRQVYKTNLAIVEALIRERDIAITTLDERSYGVDLNKNGTLDMASKVVYRWAPLKHEFMNYVGQAGKEYASKRQDISAGLYPKGTEFLHSVRYLAMSGENVVMSKRMKELRYAKKTTWNNYSQLSKSVSAEIKERHDYPNRLSQYHASRHAGIEKGLYNGRGWRYQGFIEDVKGALRPQSYEETLSCMGCHTGVGATVDSSFSFPRKFNHDSFQQSFYHWSQKGLSQVADPKRQDGQHEYSFYLANNNTANEYRNNFEIKDKFFKDGKLVTKMSEQLVNDISTLLVPSAARARTLNKAYKVIVDEQSYTLGREAHVLPITSVYKKIPVGDSTGIKTPIASAKI